MPKHLRYAGTMHPRLKTNLTPERQKQLRSIGGRIVQENEIKLAEALEENVALKELYENRVAERERLNYKYAKSQSQFFEIMRELTRFREDFQAKHSLRSKFLKTKKISDQLGTLIQTNFDILN